MRLRGVKGIGVIISHGVPRGTGLLSMAISGGTDGRCFTSVGFRVRRPVGAGGSGRGLKVSLKISSVTALSGKMRFTGRGGFERGRSGLEDTRGRLDEGGGNDGQCRGREFGITGVRRGAAGRES